MKKIFSGAALILVVAGIAYFSHLPAKNEKFDLLTIEKKAGGKQDFRVEIAATPAELEKGLMFREKIDSGHGMLFELGKTAVTRFWMKNTLVPLDMIFIAPGGEIKKIHENAVPKSLSAVSSVTPVNAVLEIGGGEARALGISAGDRVVHPYFTSK